jgi:hypothetical protein
VGSTAKYLRLICPVRTPISYLPFRDPNALSERHQQPARSLVHRPSPPRLANAPHSAIIAGIAMYKVHPALPRVGHASLPPQASDLSLRSVSAPPPRAPSPIYPHPRSLIRSGLLRQIPARSLHRPTACRHEVRRLVRHVRGRPLCRVPHRKANSAVAHCRAA